MATVGTMGLIVYFYKWACITNGQANGPKLLKVSTPVAWPDKLIPSSVTGGLEETMLARCEPYLYRFPGFAAALPNLVQSQNMQLATARCILSPPIFRT